MLDSKDFLILANGKNENFSKKFLKKLLSEKTVISLDGACEILYQFNLIPDCILGDLDSVTKETLEYCKSKGSKIVYAFDQNFSDLEKGIMYCRKNSAQSITIINASYGRFDHFIANLFFLKKYYKKSCPIKILSNSSCIMYVQNETITISSHIGAKCGFFGLPKCLVQFSKGLKYSLDGKNLILGEFESMANEFISESVACKIEGDCLLTYEM